MNSSEMAPGGPDDLDGLAIPVRTFFRREDTASHPDLVAARSYFSSVFRAEVKPDGSVVIDFSGGDSRDHDFDDDC